MGSSYGKNDFLILRLDRDFNINWQRAYGQPDIWESAYDIQETADGGYIVAGSQEQDGGYYFRPLIMKISEAGEIQWQRALGSKEKHEMYGHHIRESSGGEYFLVDDTYSSSAGEQDLWVVKFSASGSLLWQKLYGGKFRELARGVFPTSDGGCLVVASSESFGAGKADFWVLKLDSNGDVEWQKTYGTSDFYEYPFYVLQTDLGDYVICGYAVNDLVSYSKVKMMIIKIAPNGDLGPCWLVNDTDAIIAAPSIPVYDYNATWTLTNAFALETAANPQSTDSYPILICSNFHQPPTNISVAIRTNSSLFKKEYYNELTWEPDSWNDRFNIVQYRIYRKETSDPKYQLLTSVSSNVLSYLDGPVDAAKKYEYRLTSLDSEGSESPWSIPVKTY
jgi:hypothetical protein